MWADRGRTVLVTGGAGFIGSNLVETLLRRGGDVRVLDDFSSGRRENLAEAPEWAREGGGRFELIEGTICDPSTAARSMRGVGAVLHHAAVASVPLSVRDPLLSHEVNVRGTLLLLLAARDAGVARFVFASSCAVYGDDPAMPKVETMLPSPISPYANDKLSAENSVGLFHRLYGLPALSLRYFNVVGPRQDPKSDYAAVVPRFAMALLEGKSPVIYGDGLQTRDFNPVANVVEANLRALDAPESACGRVYNIAKGERLTLLALARRMAELAGAQVEPVHEGARPGDIRHSEADISSAREALGYRAEAGVDEGLAGALAWCRTMVARGQRA